MLKQVTIWLLRFIFFYQLIAVAHGQLIEEGDWYIKQINIPKKFVEKPIKKEVVIAVVDDGVRTTHQSLKGFIWKNPKEIARNHVDDDGNGFIDDVNGWDVSDSNNKIDPPSLRLDEYYHGTHLSSIITKIVSTYFTESASRFIKIMPVKSLSDEAKTTYLKDGFQGIKYAIKAGADIILCSWSVAHISKEESDILQEAHDKGIIIIASAGNFPEDREQYPAAHPTVVAVAASNTKNKKIKKSNYGQFVDLLAPGINIRGASSLSDSKYKLREGTSFSTAMVAAAAALVRWQHPTFSNRQVEACLKSSATAIKETNPLFTGKLGVGLLNVGEAINCDILTKDTQKQKRIEYPQGFLHLNLSSKKQISWMIKPQGQFRGIRFKPMAVKGDVNNAALKFYSGDSLNAQFIESYPLSNPPENIYIPGTQVYVVLETEDSEPNFDGLIEFEIDPINYRNLYCHGKKKLNEEGILEDGSGFENYSMETSCQWLITAPKGKVIHFKFTKFDTEAMTDWVYFFNGEKTNEKVMAGFSGSDIPPELTTWRNQVLVWFLSDGKNQGKGWQAVYSFQDISKN